MVATATALVEGGRKAIPYLEIRFGEDTSLPITILAAKFHTTVLPNQGSALVETELVVANTSVHHAIEGKLRFPLPQGAQVVRYAFEMAQGNMVDAMALSKRKAAEVAYREREAGRNVSTAEQVEGNLFETTIFPLPYNEERRFSLSYTTKLSPVAPAAAAATTSEAPKSADQWEISIPLRFKTPLRSLESDFSVTPAEQFRVWDNLADAPADGTVPDNGLVVTLERVSESSGFEITTGTLIGQTHFSAFLPRNVIEHGFSSAPLGTLSQERFSLVQRSSKQHRRVCVLLDTSASMSKSAAAPEWEQFVQALVDSHHELKEEVSFTLQQWSTSLEEPIENLDGKALLDRIRSAHYDGGTNLATLSAVFLAEVERQERNKAAAGSAPEYDYFVLCTDGVDNIGATIRPPQGVEHLSKAVHVLTPPAAGMLSLSLSLLESLEFNH